MKEKVYSGRDIELFHDIIADDVYINVIDSLVRIVAH